MPGEQWAAETKRREDGIQSSRKVSGVGGCADGGIATRTGNAKSRAGLGERKNGMLELKSGHIFINFLGVTRGRYPVRLNHEQKKHGSCPPAAYTSGAEGQTKQINPQSNCRSLQEEI